MSSDCTVLVVDKHPEYLSLVAGYARDAGVDKASLKTLQQVTDVSLDIALTSDERQVAFLDYETVASLCNGRVALWLQSVLSRIARNTTAIVIVSGTGDELLAVRMMQAGAKAYIPKRLLSTRLVAESIQGVSAFSDPELPDRTDSWNTANPSSALSIARRKSQTAASSRPRVSVDGYEILRELYKSGDATLYLANSDELQERIALKVIEKATGDELTMERCQREYDTVSKLNHPYIVDIYEFGIVDSFAYIAMEYFPCGDLKNRMTNPISPRQSINYLYQICEGLGQLHAKGIVHRDIKPPNVMLREDNTIALIDFGLAKDNSSQTFTRMDEIRGTPYYMSPEQIQGHTVDARSDIYALGIMLFEMLTGSRPFTGKNVIEVIGRHVNDPIPRLPSELEQFQPIIDRVAAKRPEDRYPTTGELSQELRQWVDSG